MERPVEQLASSSASSATWPAYITSSRSKKWLTSDMSCVTKITAKPSSFCSSLICTISERWATTSSAEVGSSMMIRSGVKSERHRDHRALPHPARELVRIAVQVHRVDGDEAQDLARADFDLRLRPVGVGLAGVAHLLGDGQHRVERIHRALHHDREIAPADGSELSLLEQHEVAALEQHAPADDLPGIGAPSSRAIA